MLMYTTDDAIMLGFIIYQPPSPRSDILFGVVILKCLSGAKIVY